ncbi:MAG: hypothetical protein Ta2G_09950 [Termitinemataceae bacterium]|nr:MAG: hypothetical protein Ta2G_09950 [Termitinemataceae bacterium]
MLAEFDILQAPCIEGIMKNKIVSLIIGLAAGTIAVQAQTVAIMPEAKPLNVLTLAQIDDAAADTAKKIRPELTRLGQGSRVKIGDFLLDRNETALGTYWRMQLAGDLASGAKYEIICPDAGDTIISDYTITGNIMETNDTVRIFMRLIRVNGPVLVKAWTFDFARNEFIESITEIATSSGIRRDRWENDTRFSPIELPVGTADLARTIHDKDDNDWFRFIPPQSGRLTVETTGNLDTYMYLYEGEIEEPLMGNDDGGTASNAKIVRTVKAGTAYIVRVKGLESATGSYGINARFELPPQDSDEPNDTPETAIPLQTGVNWQSVYAKENDIDWYKVEIPAGGRMLTVSASSDAEQVIAVYAGDDISKLQLLAEEADCSCGDTTVRLSVKVPQGQVFIKLTAALQDGYTLRADLRDLPVPDAFEDDDRISQAKPIAVGESQERTFSDSDDVDWVKLLITERGDYDIRVTDTRDNLDSSMRLFLDDEDDEIDSDDDSGSNYNPRIRRSLDPGTYFIKIRCLDNDPLRSNRYTLRVSK